MVYIHIPFCRKICNYCDFHHSASLLRVDEMVDAIERELRIRHDFIASTKTLYFGGGTPSVCSAQQLKRLIDTVRELWNVSQFEELTLEANPEDCTTDYLEALRALGVNRLSIGIQSFTDEHLEKMNRRHSSAQAVRAVRNAREVGFNNITIDLMYGLPFMTTEQWHSNLAQALELGVEHISAYHLTIEPNTIFGKRGLQAVDESISDEQFEMLHKTLTRSGYEHYEVSNFAREGFRALHNSGYWQGIPYLGVGASAHSFDGCDRREWNVISNKLYLEGAPRTQECLTEQDTHNEFLMTRLRTADGFSKSDYEQRFDRKILPSQGLNIVGDRVFIEAKDFLISDKIIASLFEIND